jgi:hypothetical protein
MTGNWVFAQLISLGHGLTAAFISVAAFYLTGLLLLPRRWQSSLRWPDSVVFGLSFYVLLCWVGTSSRNIPVIYVILVFGAALWGLAAVRFRWLQATYGASHKNPATRRWVVGFSILYVFAYLLIRPPAGAAVLTLPSDGALDLVTYARYAKHLLTYGTANVDLATFEYLHSPASAYLLAWHSLLYLGDPLDAAMPLVFMLAALFGSITMELARSMLGLSWRAAMTIAAIAVCAPMFRWTLATYSLGELLSATSVLYLTGAFGSAAVTKSLDSSRIFGIATGGTLLFFSAWPAAGTLTNIALGVVEVGRHFSPLAVFGLPSGTPLAASTPDVLPSAALVVLPLVPLVWAAAAWALHRPLALDRIGTSAVDRKLAGALVIYVAVAVVVGNVAVQAVRAPAPVYWPGAWRELYQIARMPFQAFTLKVADEPNGLSTALAMYYVPGRKVHVIGRGVSLDHLPFETVSRQEPMFIQNFGCQGVGHGDTVSAPGVGCLLMAPPSMTVGTSYPFNQTFLFLDFDRMTSREPGGRWNTESTLNLRLTADPQRARLDRDMYINFLVNPFLPAGVKPQRLVLRWGTGRRGEVVVGERQWFSLPVGSNDWSGNRLWKVPVAIDFLDGRTILFHEVALTESPRGKVAEIAGLGP